MLQISADVEKHLQIFFASSAVRGDASGYLSIQVRLRHRHWKGENDVEVLYNTAHGKTPHSTASTRYSMAHRTGTAWHTVQHGTRYSIAHGTVRYTVQHNTCYICRYTVTSNAAVHGAVAHEKLLTVQMNEPQYEEVTEITFWIELLVSK